MKGLNFIKGMALAALVFCAASCNDSDDDQTPAGSVVGTYTGYSEAASTYFSGMYADDETATIAEGADGKLTCTFDSESWGSFSFSDVAVVRDGNDWRFTASGSTQMGMNGNIKEYDATLSGRTDASHADFEIAFTVPSVMGGLTITLRPGSAPVAEEE